MSKATSVSLFCEYRICLFTPDKISLNHNSNSLLVLGNDFKDAGNSSLYEYDLNHIAEKQNTSEIIKIEADRSVTLGPDIVLANNFSLDDQNKFLLIPSPKTKTLGILDLKNFTLVKKIPTKDKIHKIIFI